MPWIILLDVVLVGLLLWGAQRGHVSGAWYQLKNTGVLIAAVWVPVHFGSPLAHLFEGRIGVRYNVLFFCTVAGLWLTTELVGSFVVRALESAWLRLRASPEKKVTLDHRKRWRPKPPDNMSLADRYAGALLSAAQYAVMIWLILSLVVVVEEDIGIPVSQSRLFQFVDHRNAVTMFFAPQADRLERALQKATAAGHKLKGHDPFAKLRGDPRVKAALEQAAHHPGGALRSAESLSVLTDPNMEANLEAALKESDSEAVAATE